jgi:acyl transferase domain-containing protein
VFVLLDVIIKRVSLNGGAHSLQPGDRWRLDSQGAPSARFGGTVANIAEFDLSAFHVTESEACYIDPQHRLLLELALESFVSSGRALASSSAPSVESTEIGVAVGISVRPSPGARVECVYHSTI